MGSLGESPAIGSLAATTLRSGRPDDLDACATICYEAFRSIAERHGFPPDFPSVAAAASLLGPLFSKPGVDAVVIEDGGRILASNFVWHAMPVLAIGPLTVDPAVQNAALGRRLMEDALQRAARAGYPAVRLVQAAYHGRSMSLYAKSGFEVREPLACLQGPPIAGGAAAVPGRDVRPARADDVDACNALCRRVHGHERKDELFDALAEDSALLVERDGRVAGYATQLGFLGHAVADTNEDLAALIAAAPAFAGPGFLLPVRNGELFRWCLAHGLRVVQPMSLMTRGLYNEPRGAWLPSVLY